MTLYEAMSPWLSSPSVTLITPSLTVSRLQECDILLNLSYKLSIVHTAAAETDTHYYQIQHILYFIFGFCIKIGALMVVEKNCKNQ